MSYRRLHRGEFVIGDVLVDRLLATQMPQWAGLPRRPVEPPGTDNVMIRLGETLAARLPRTEQAAAALVKEQRLLPRLAAHVPVAIPAPAGFGAPGFGYPWPWSVCSWVPGRNPEPGEADITLARDLADFVRSLHRAGTFGLKSEGLLHSYRADSIQLRDAITRRSIDKCDGLLDRAEVRETWDRARRVPEFSGPHVWAHADLHPGNLVMRGGRLAAVIDWGSLILADPAIDCMAAWTLLGPDTRPEFRARACVDDGTWLRGRAWSLSIALVALPYYIHSNQQITKWARYAIRQVVEDIAAD